MPKAIKSDARNIILKVKSFFEEEARAGSPIIPFSQVYKRISAATGVNQGLISKIVKEGQAAERDGTKIRTPGKERKRKSGFVNVDDFDMGIIRRKVVVIIVIWVIMLLVVYMGFLICLDPLINKRAKASYQEHTNEDDESTAGGPSQPARVPGNVLNRVTHQQDKWKRQVREQRRNIYDRHTMLN